MKAHSRIKRKALPNPERAAWRKLRDLLIDSFGSVTAAAKVIDCHPNSFRAIEDCPRVKDRLIAELKKKGVRL